ncbi:hypothetical protein [Pedobacter alpinus]|uniref:hypothetical protein n=1 Tax=Pedobacter alpinus TaxID=1590643 RepID=UPI00366D1ACF
MLVEKIKGTSSQRTGKMLHTCAKLGAVDLMIRYYKTYTNNNPGTWPKNIVTLYKKYF